MSSGWENRESISNVVNSLQKTLHILISMRLWHTHKRTHSLYLLLFRLCISWHIFLILWQNLSLGNKKRYIKMNPWRSEEEQRERDVMRVEKDRQLKARLMEEENLDKKRYIRQFQEGLKERKMEDSFLKVRNESCPRASRPNML